MKLLVALAKMVDQFCGSSKGFADLQAMSAPQRAAEALADYDLMKVFDARTAQWTDAGKKLLEDTAKPEFRGTANTASDAKVLILKQREP
ncbi:hypothetical protein [Bradyrhizobium sp. JR3.5]